jgi:hypothetical protein
MFTRGTGLGEVVDTRIECWCRTCERYVTVEEIEQDYHARHEFGPEDMAALQAVKQYLAFEKGRVVKGGNST